MDGYGRKLASSKERRQRHDPIVRDFEGEGAVAIMSKIETAKEGRPGDTEQDFGATKVLNTG